MTLRPFRSMAVALAASVIVTVTADDAAAQPRLLDVPYVAQSVDLCGGAALAMVLRYWGDRTAVAEDFAALVDPEAGGITTGRLVEAAHARGWRTAPASRLDLVALGEHVDQGRPPLVLIEERSGVLHYVVVVAVTAEAVLMHDPARAPFREMPIGEFDRRWAVTNRWMLIVLPGDATRTLPDEKATPDDAAPRPASPCAEAVARGVAAAQADRLDEAERWLLDAAARCPAATGPRLELAGVRVRQGRWPEALALAESAAKLDANDAHAWRIAAAARYRLDDLSGALDAMAATGESGVDIVNVSGARITPRPVVVDATGLAPGIALTGAAFERARRRLADLPAAERTRLGFKPATDGVAIEAAVAERDPWPRRWTSWSAMAARAALTSTMRMDLAGVAGSGELWTGVWRWTDARPLGAVAVAVPSPAGMPGVTTVEGLWEAQSYAAGVVADDALRQSRHRVALGVADWITGSLRWSGSAGIDRFDDRRFGSATIGLEWYRRDDQLAAGAEGSLWAAPGARSFGTVAVDVAWRSRSASEARQWGATAGLSAASTAAPPALWSGAGNGRAGRALLRAHPLLERDVISGDAFGRRLAHASVEYVQPVFTHPMARAAIVGFADAARADARGGRPGAAWHADVGAALRLTGPPALGSVDVSAAYGLRDGRLTLAFAVRPPWPGFRRPADGR